MFCDPSSRSCELRQPSLYFLFLETSIHIQAPIFLFKNRPIPLQAYDHSYIEIKLATEDVPLVKEHLTVMLWFRSGDVRGVRTLVDLSRDPIQLKQISHEVVA